jgi:hypothetical protein
MSMALRIGLAALLLMLSQLSANAQLVKVGSTPIVLTAPQGHCGLTKEEVDITFNERMRGGAHVLAAYYDCQELAQLRSGERETAEHYAQYIAPGPPLNVEINEQSISGLCAIWREKGERIHKDVSEKKGMELRQLAGVESFNFVGVLAEEQGACYSGQLAEVSAKGVSVMMAGIMSNVLVKGKLVNYQFIAPYRGDKTFPNLLNQHKANVAALRAANSR